MLGKKNKQINDNTKITKVTHKTKFIVIAHKIIFCCYSYTCAKQRFVCYTSQWRANGGDNKCDQSKKRQKIRGQRERSEKKNNDIAQIVGV